MRPHTTTPDLEMKMGISDCIASPVLRHVTGNTGKTDNVSRANRATGGDVYSAQVPVLRVKAAGMRNDDLISICAARIRLNICDCSIPGGDNWCPNRCGDVYSGM
jgi:hypothetical protein